MNPESLEPVHDTDLPLLLDFVASMMTPPTKSLDLAAAGAKTAASSVVMETKYLTTDRRFGQ